MPDESIFCLHWLRLDEAKIYVDLDALLDHSLVDSVTISVFCDLAKDSAGDQLLSLSCENLLVEHVDASFTDHLQLTILEIVPVQVVKDLVHHF